MKNSLSIISIVLAISAIVISLLLLNNKKQIVYVDSVKLITNYKGSKTAKEGYEKKVAIWQANIDTLMTEMNDQITQYETEKSKMTAREKKLSEELLATKQQQLESYKQATAENAKKEDQQITSRVFGEINDFLKKYGEAHGYEFIMAATQTGNIVYSKKENNITDEVLEKINAEYQTGGK